MNVEGAVFIILAISAASERMVELTKSVVSRLREMFRKDPTVELKPWLSKTLAAVYSIVSIWIASGEIGGAIGVKVSPFLAFILGMLCSGGAGIWHDLLGIVQGVKSGKQASDEARKLQAPPAE